MDHAGMEVTVCRTMMPSGDPDELTWRLAFRTRDGFDSASGELRRSTAVDLYWRIKMAPADEWCGSAAKTAGSFGQGADGGREWSCRACAFKEVEPGLDKSAQHCAMLLIGRLVARLSGPRVRDDDELHKDVEFLFIAAPMAGLDVGSKPRQHRLYGVPRWLLTDNVDGLRS